MSNINQTMSDLCVVGAYFSSPWDLRQVLILKSELAQKETHHVGLKEFRNKNLAQKMMTKREGKKKEEKS